MPARPATIPSQGPKREALREKGQFWTPAWIAKAMVRYVLTAEPETLFDPAVGAGAFFVAAKGLLTSPVRFAGTEVDRSALAQAIEAGLSPSELAGVQIRDFVLNPPSEKMLAIVANPPYIRHHRLTGQTKAQLRVFSAALLGFQIDGRAGYHVYFLLRALDRLAEDGRLAFIMPADTCEGVFARRLWCWITKRFRLDAVVSFAAHASPFPGVDTNALVFFIRRARPREDLWWVKCMEPETPDLEDWVGSGFRSRPGTLTVLRTPLQRQLECGLSREPHAAISDGASLGDFVSVMRGIATGANDFFFLSQKRAFELRIPHSYLLPAVGRTRDVNGDVLRPEDLSELDRKGRPTLLVALDGRPVSAFPPAVQEYISKGEKAGLAEKPLIATRKPWYKMERRTVPPFLFAYLGRRNTRFIKNLANAVPLTGFLCVYPRNTDPAIHDALWRLLSHPDTLASLARVGKTYGGGAIKVEPRALERLPLSKAALRESGLASPHYSEQLALRY